MIFADSTLFVHVIKEIMTENQVIVSHYLYPDPGSNRDGLLQRCLRPSRLPIPPSGLMVVGLHGAKLRNFFYSLRVAGIILHGGFPGAVSPGIRGIHGGTGDFRRCSLEAGSRTFEGAQGVEGGGRKGLGMGVFFCGGGLFFAGGDVVVVDFDAEDDGGGDGGDGVSNDEGDVDGFAIEALDYEED